MNLYQINIIIYSFGFKISAPEIREYFKYLENLGYGICRGAEDNLEFSAK